MTTLYFDSVGGASGDMILASLIDLGVDRGWLEGELNKLGLGVFRLNAEATTDKGIRGLRLTMELPAVSGGKAPSPPETPGHAHSHGGIAGFLHKLTGHSHDHGHSHSHGGESHTHAPAETGAHRGLAEIEAILTRANLPAPVLENCLKVFRRIGEAEARVHATTPDKIHFHEVGALDSIADIVGCNLALHKLGIEKVAVAPLPIGQGTVKCAHGILPLPAPATVELLAGFPTFAVDETKETVTPTGAALISTWRNAERPALGTWTKVGHGLGTSAMKGRPNLIRAFLYSAIEQPVAGEACLVLECNLDDCTPEIVGALSGKLLENGALDVFTIPVQMKKQRPGMLLTVLCKPENRDSLLDLLFRESTTFGVREHRAERTVLERRFETVATPYGPIRIKVGVWKGQAVTASPEFEDCAAAAQKAGVPIKAVYQAASAARPS